MSFTIDDIDFAYVNLDCRPDRRAHAEAEFAKHGLNARRVPGLLTTRENVKPDPMVQRMYDRTPGAIGCWLSQLRAIGETDADKIAGVCEDDVCLCDDFCERLKLFATEIPTDWDVAWLGSTFHCNPPVWHKTSGRDAHRVTKHVFRAFGCWSTYAWLLHPAAASQVSALFDEHMHESDGIDHCFIKFVEPVLKTYCFVPGLAWQYDNRSNIGNGVTEFSLFKKHLGAYAWADRMEEFNPDQYDFAEAGYE